MSQQINAIQKELNSFSVSTLTEKDKVRFDFLKGFILDQNKEYERPEPLLFCCGLPLFLRGEISGIAGKAKSRKSFFITLIIAYMLGKKDKYFSAKDKTNKVIYIDTEQDAYRVKTIQKRINLMLGNAENEEIRNIIFVPLLQKNESTSEKDFEITDIEIFLQVFKPTCIIIDNIGDFCEDNNNEEKSKELMHKIQKYASNYKCHFICTLHTSEKNDKDDPKALGALGRLLMQKSATQINLSKVNTEDKFSNSKIDFTRTRDLPPEPLYMNINNENGLGIPYIVDEQPQNAIKKSKSDISKETIKNILPVWFANGVEYSYGELKDKICKLIECKETTSETIIKEFRENGDLECRKDGRITKYSLSSENNLFCKEDIPNFEDT